MKYILSIDQGTTSSRAILFNKQMKIEAIAQKKFLQHFPNSAWLEDDPRDIWSTVATTCRGVMKRVGAKATDIVSIGITNEREITRVWDKKTGESVYNAIVCQDRRTGEFCKELKNACHEEMIRNKTCLMIDPYFSGLKLNWILEERVEPLIDELRKEELYFGWKDAVSRTLSK